MKTLFFAVIFLVTTGPGSAETPSASAADAPGFCIFGGGSGKPFSGNAAFKSIIWKSDIIYVGETHGQPKDHAAQLEALKAMREARGSKIVAGFEMLNPALQPVLDDYAAGKISEEEFLQRTGWEKEWGFDFGLYRPLFDFIRENRLKALALNLPEKIVSKIAAQGLDSLTPEEKRYLPEKVEITKNKKYLDRLKKSFDGQGGAPDEKTSKFENYLAAMCAWNETMGARLADFMNKNPGYAALAVIGNEHVLYNAAMPASVKARGAKLRQASFYTEDAAACPPALPKEHKDMAGYLWYISHSGTAAPAAVQAKSASTP